MDRPSPGSTFCASGSNAGTSCRATAVSTDLGITWGNITAHPEMPDPRCKGGIVRWAGANGQRALFAINPASLSSRVNETISASVDDGVSFSYRKLCIDSSGGYGTINLNSASTLLPPQPHVLVPPDSSGFAKFGKSFTQRLTYIHVLLRADANMLAAFYDHAPGNKHNKSSSSNAAGGCSFNLVVVDPAKLLA